MLILTVIEKHCCHLPTELVCCAAAGYVCHEIRVACSRVLLEELLDPLVVKIFPKFWGTWRFITMFTSPCHMSLSWARLIQSMPSHPVSLICRSMKYEYIKRFKYFYISNFTDGIIARLLWNDTGGSERCKKWSPVVQNKYEAWKIVLWPFRLQ